MVANYTVTDGSGATSTSTLTITVTGANDAPVAVDEVQTVAEDATVTGSVAANDTDVDGDPLIYTVNGAAPAGFTLNDYLVGLDATWEPDVWGRVARSVESAKASAQASAADMQAVLLSMQAELATDYFELRGIDRERQLLDDTLAAYRESLALTQHRYDGGIATDADVGQAQTQLQTTEAQAIENKEEKAAA